jgi:hypothetical protein
MKGKQLLILIVASAVLGGAGLLLTRQDASRMTDSKLGMGKPVLGGLDINSVSGIRIRTGSSQLNVVRDGETWVVRERNSYPAGFGSVSDFLRKLDGLKVTRPVEVGPSRLPVLDLVAPEQGGGTQLELLGSDGKTLRNLLLGKTHSRGGGEEASGFGDGGMANGRYVQMGADPKQIVLVSDPLGTVNTRAEDWLDKTFFKVELPLRVEITRPDEATGFILSRTNEFSEWVWEDAGAEEKLDSSKTSLFGSLLSAPTFTDVVIDPDDAALGLDKPAVARIQTTTGFIYELRIGKAQANEDYPVRIQVSGDWPKARTPAPDEKPEDKDRLDKEFQTALVAKEEKLRSDQKFGRWTYLVSRWSIEPVLKTRKDLGPSAPAEAAPDPGGNPFGVPSLPSLSLPPGQ